MRQRLLQPGGLVLLAALAAWALLAPVHAGNPPRPLPFGPPRGPMPPGPADPSFFEKDDGRYPKVPFNSKDVESLFLEQLKGAKELDFARDLLEQVKKKSGLPKEWLNDPRLLEKLKPFFKSLGMNKPVKDMTDKEKMDLFAKVKEWQKKLDAKNDIPWDGQPPDFGDPGKDLLPTPPNVEVKKDASWLNQDRLKELLQEWMEGADGSEFGRWLRESDAWRNTIEELKGHLQDLDAPDFKFDLSFLQDGFNNIRSLPTPRLPRLSVPSLGVSRLAGPASGGGVSTGAIQSVVWLVVVILIAGAALYAYRQWQPRRVVLAQAGLGPWPVDPGSVSTREQLRRAFEYLAFLTLGPSAETWNHRRIAGAWALEAGQKRDAALSLAALYEQARYTPGPDQLSPTEADLARGSLRALTPTGPKTSLVA